MATRALALVTVTVGLVSGGLVPTGLGAQDVEWLAEHYGTTPPDAYFEELARDPAAYRLARGWRARLGLSPAVGIAGAAALRAAAVLGRPAGPVVGTFEIPLLLGLYSDTPAIPTADVGAASGVSLTQAVVQREFFDGPNSRVATLTEFYTELSGGRVTLVGETQDWFQASLSGDDVTGNSNGLSSTDDVGEFIVELLADADDGTVDWGRFDNDGPDRIPNSLDDVLLVVLLAVIHQSFVSLC